MVSIAAIFIPGVRQLALVGMSVLEIGLDLALGDNTGAAMELL
ncbi:MULTISPECIES: hypothetical protein [Clostridium]|nr:hypothetical protein [Clostridium sporogenes]